MTAIDQLDGLTITTIRQCTVLLAKVIRLMLSNLVRHNLPTLTSYM